MLRSGDGVQHSFFYPGYCGSERIHDEPGDDHDEPDDLRQRARFFEDEYAGKNADGQTHLPENLNVTDIIDMVHGEEDKDICHGTEEPGEVSLITFEGAEFQLFAPLFFTQCDQ